jgi:nucleotide-binding universal stress UspA family protein
MQPTNQPNSTCGPVLVLVDRDERDLAVLNRALALAEHLHSTVWLLHVVRTPVEDATSEERHAMHDLLVWQARLSMAGHSVQVADVFFGEPVAEVTRAAAIYDAQAIVVAAQPRRWLAWFSRERRLARRLLRPLVVVRGRTPGPLRDALAQYGPGQLEVERRGHLEGTLVAGERGDGQAQPLDQRRLVGHIEVA